MERWTLSTCGKTLEGANPSDVKKSLSAMGLPQTLISSIFSGEKLVLKRRAALSDVKKLAASLKRCGLQTNVMLNLNRDVFEQGLQAINPDPERDVSWPIYVFNDRPVTPSLIGLQGESAISDLDTRDSYKLRNNSYFWHSKFLLVSLLIGGFVCETYFVRVSAELLGWQSAATALGVLLLAFCVFVMPRLLQPLSHFSIASNTPSFQSFSTIEKTVLFIGKRRFSVYDEVGAELATIERNASSAILSLERELGAYYWDKSYSLANIGDRAVEGIQSGVVQDVGVSIFSDYFQWFEKLFGVFRKRLEAKDVNWDSENGHVILDQDNKVMAMVYPHPHPAIKLRKHISNEAKLLLFSFAVCLLRSNIA